MSFTVFAIACQSAFAHRAEHILLPNGLFIDQQTPLDLLLPMNQTQCPEVLRWRLENIRTEWLNTLVNINYCNLYIIFTKLNYFKVYES